MGDVGQIVGSVSLPHIFIMSHSSLRARALATLLGELVGGSQFKKYR